MVITQEQLNRLRRKKVEAQRLVEKQKTINAAKHKAQMAEMKLKREKYKLQAEIRALRRQAKGKMPALSTMEQKRKAEDRKAKAKKIGKKVSNYLKWFAEN